MATPLLCNAGRVQCVQPQTSLAGDKGGDGAGQDRRGIGKRAAPVAGMMRTVAQIHVEVNPNSAAAAEEYGGTIGGKPGPIGSKKQVGLQLIAQLLAHLSQIRRPDLFTR